MYKDNTSILPNNVSNQSIPAICHMTAWFKNLGSYVSNINEKQNKINWIKTQKNSSEKNFIIFYFHIKVNNNYKKKEYLKK